MTSCSFDDPEIWTASLLAGHFAQAALDGGHCKDCGPDDLLQQKIEQLDEDGQWRLIRALENIDTANTHVDNKSIGEIVFGTIRIPQEWMDWHERKLSLLDTEEALRIKFTRLARISMGKIAPKNPIGQMQHLLQLIYDISLPLYACRRPEIRESNQGAQAVYAHSHDDGMSLYHEFNPANYMPWQEEARNLFIGDGFHEVGHVIEQTMIHDDSYAPELNRTRLYLRLAEKFHHELITTARVKKYIPHFDETAMTLNLFEINPDLHRKIIYERQAQYLEERLGKRLRAAQEALKFI